MRVYEDAPDLEVELSDVLRDADRRVDWARLRTNDNPDLVTAWLSRGAITLRFAEDRHGAAQIVFDGVDRDGFSLTVALFIAVTPTNDPPRVGAPMGGMRVPMGVGDIEFDLLDVFSDVDLQSNQDRLSFRVDNDNTSTCCPSPFKTRT